MFSHRLRRTGIHGKTSRSRSDESFKLLLVIPFAIFNPGYEQAERGGHLGKMGWERHSNEAEHSKVWELAFIARLFSHGACLKSIVELVTEIQILRDQFSKSGF